MKRLSFILACAGLTVFSAQAQIVDTFTLTTTTAAAEATVDPGCTAVDFAAMRDITVYASCLATNADCDGAVTLKFAGSPDGTTYTTSGDTNWTMTLTLNGTNTVCMAKQFDLSTMRYLKLISVGNADTNSTISSLAVIYYRKAHPAP